MQCKLIFTFVLFASLALPQCSTTPATGGGSNCVGPLSVTGAAALPTNISLNIGAGVDPAPKAGQILLGSATGKLLESDNGGPYHAIGGIAIPNMSCAFGQLVSGFAGNVPLCSPLVNVAPPITNLTCGTGQAINSFISGIPKCGAVNGGTGTVANMSCPSGQVVSGFIGNVPQCKPMASSGGLPANTNLTCSLVSVAATMANSGYTVVMNCR